MNGECLFMTICFIKRIMVKNVKTAECDWLVMDVAGVENVNRYIDIFAQM